MGKNRTSSDRLSERLPGAWEMGAEKPHPAAETPLTVFQKTKTNKTFILQKGNKIRAFAKEQILKIIVNNVRNFYCNCCKIIFGLYIAAVLFTEKKLYSVVKISKAYMLALKIFINHFLTNLF